MKTIHVAKFLLYIFFSLVFIRSNAQKKSSSGKTNTGKNIKYMTPTPLPADHLKTDLLQGNYNFVWQFEHDTSFAAGVLFREEIAFENDSVIFTQYYSKLDMHFYGGHNNVQGKTGNNIYAVYRFKMPYHLHYDVVSILNYQSKKFEDYKLVRESGFFMFEHLLRLKPQRKYKNEDNVVGSSSE